MDLLTMRGFADEFSKIAKAKPKKKRKVQDPGMSVGEAGASIGAHLALQRAHKPVTRSIGRAFFAGERNSTPTTAAQVAALRDQMAPGVSAFHSSSPKGNSAYMPYQKSPGRQDRARAEIRSDFGVPEHLVDSAIKNRKGAVFTSSNFGPHVAAHELGHAVFHGSRIGNAIHASTLPAHVLGAVGSTAMASRDPDSRAAKLAPLVGAAGVAPRLVNEGFASWHGHRAMRRSGQYTAQQLAHGRNQLLKAWGTYAAPALIPAVGLPVAIRQIRKFNKRRREEAMG